MQPGQAGEIIVGAAMHEGMDGPHLFETTVETDSKTKPVHKLYFRATWGDK